MKLLISVVVAFVLSVIPVHRSEEAVHSVTKSEVFVINVKKSHFDRVYQKIRFEEGNYAYLKHDFGLETYGGITRRWFPKWQGWKAIDAAKIKENGKKVSRLEWNQRVESAEPHVKAFYQDWWTKWNMNVIADSSAAAYTFDFAICGTPSIKVIQRCLVDMGMKNIKVTGVFTGKEVEFINTLDPVIYIETLRMMRRDFYYTISEKMHRVKGDDGKFLRDSTGNYVYAQTQKNFLNGWLIRANRVVPELKARLESRQQNIRRM